MLATIYTFTTSQPLTQKQLDYLNSCFDNLPSELVDNIDIPEWNTEITILK